MVIYCGMDSKIILNQGKYAFKQSQIEKKINLVLLFNIVIILTFSGIFAGRLYHFIKDHGSKMRYVYPEPVINAASYAGNAYASFFIIFNSLIPLGMLVTLEIAKLAYSPFIEHDVEMIGETTASRVQNLTLHEQLSQVNYMLCDKTGTLTQNELRLRAVADVGGGKFEGDTSGLEAHCKGQGASGPFSDLWRCITICHDVLVITIDGKRQLSGASQDEIELLSAGEQSKYACLTNRDTE